MKTSTKLDMWFWLTGGMSMFSIVRNDLSGAAPFLIIAFMALFASYIAELIERQD